MVLALLPPNESRLSGGQANSPGAQLLPYLILDCLASQPRLARRCRRWLGSAPLTWGSEERTRHVPLGARAMPSTPQSPPL